jgi:hypothetical protein
MTQTDKRKLPKSEAHRQRISEGLKAYHGKPSKKARVGLIWKRIGELRREFRNRTDER